MQIPTIRLSLGNVVGGIYKHPELANRHLVRRETKRLRDSYLVLWNFAAGSLGALANAIRPGILL